MLSSSPRDNWERLVAAVVKRDEIWQLCHQDSITTATANVSSYSGNIHSIFSNRSEHLSVSPPRQPSLATTSGADVKKNASGPKPWKLFSALQRRRKPKNDHLDDIPEDLQLHLGQFGRFSLHELQLATENFHSVNIIGRGAQSKIYKGRLADGSLVAVKRFTTEVKEMGKELEITTIAAHRNVLRARGFCSAGKERLLVYPYMVNQCVASRLRERHESLPPLDWPVRKQIALGAAKGLAYLHHECLRKIVHRDVKAANILLNDDFEAVVADFNLAEFMDCYDDGDVVTPVKGTIGHIAPEYLATGKCSLKTDVFGYGVFLLELITAQRSYDHARVANESDVMLLNMVKGSYKERKWKTMVDADLKGDFVEEEVKKLLQIALICTQTDAAGRPTMPEVVRMLEVGYGLDERWKDWYERDCKDENFELGYLRRFTLDKLEAATDYFSYKIISKDGFNMIYKGWLDGSPVAVKRYSSQSLEYYFEKELDIGRICLHPNVVHVIGFCQTIEERLLVFRLMINGSVESWLKGRHESRSPLTWQKRREIALGAARGLAYLHDKCGKKIIHRDVKASNMLLDENFEVAVADFGMAKFMDWKEICVTTIVRGTIGHIAPEYLGSGECSDKTDVYGYGVFLLELVSGQRAFDLLRLAKDEGMMLIDWVKRNYEERNWEVMVDKDISGDDFMEEEVVWHLVQIALLCTRSAPYERLRMSEVLLMFGDGDGSSDAATDDDDDTRGVAPEELSGPR